MAVREPLTKEVLLRHVRGLETVGCYLVHEQLTSSAVIDIDTEIDLRETFEIAKIIQKRFDVLGLPSSLEFSGRRGFHLWFFAERPLPAVVWREALYYVLPEHLRPPVRGQVSCEIFPKQNLIAPGSLGSLIKLPLGKHRWGKWSCFLDQSGKPSPFTYSYVDIDSVYGLGKREPKPEKELTPEEEARQSTREKVRKTINMQDLIKSEFGIYVPERRQFRCLFHEDSRPSAAIYNNIDGWLYICFAEGCRKKGRDVIDIITESKGYSEWDAIAYLRDWWRRNGDNNS